MANFISHLHLKGGLGDTLPLGDVVTTLRSGTGFQGIEDAAVANNGNAIVIWNESEPDVTTQGSPWVARRVSGQWLEPERLVPAALNTAPDALNQGRAVGIGTDGAFYAVVSGLSVTSRARVYRNTGSGWEVVGGDLTPNAVPHRLVTRAGGVMTLILKRPVSPYTARAIRIDGDTVSATSAIGNTSVYGAVFSTPVYSGITGEIAVVLSFAVSSSNDNGATWTTSTDDPLSGEGAWNAWMSQDGELRVVWRDQGGINPVKTFGFARRTADGVWTQSPGITIGGTDDVTGIRVAGDWVTYQESGATYARKLSGSAFGPAVELTQTQNGYSSSVDSILQYADGSYVGELFTADGFTYITNDGGEWNPRSVPSGFEFPIGSILSLSPDRRYSVGFVYGYESDPEVTPGGSRKLMATVHRRPA